MKLKTKKMVERHVRDDDYFTTAATILDLLQQELARGRGRSQWTIECLQGVRDDLLFLQKRYRIIRRRTYPKEAHRVKSLVGASSRM
jgi:hypothetical protein